MTTAAKRVISQTDVERKDLSDYIGKESSRKTISEDRRVTRSSPTKTIP
jgi:hypothetical protein